MLFLHIKHSLEGNVQYLILLFAHSDASHYNMTPQIMCETIFQDGAVRQTNAMNAITADVKHPRLKSTSETLL